ncbi:glycine cleavage system aminomethyltransferase GcvT [Ktedonosporobacter rubrisoli]|uniref:Aminomethyltransferase n=1 Tax=Ktedonosporobacter rubrisoli TaxID=2509675 RepID=A0A4V0YZR7_KTERU|nr:glycine cleavage system aminomethyltransferase GcvT [Ktedonosporobacter rubrisoli]QBD80661.1 glycine cleavage system aminomethyltransferase GcvT [Ktedonosporobacter rubrisoli]
MTTSDKDVAQLKRTPLYEQHRALGARLVEFSGWEMPIQYSGIIEEHQAVRTRAGLFDVSHMGEFKVEGPDAQAFLQYLVPNDVSKLAIHQALYTPLCLPDGNTIDDLLIYHLAEQHYMLVVNAGNIEKDLQWVQSQAKRFANVTISDQSDTTALLALQGPAALSILQPLTPVDLNSILYYHFVPGQVDGIDCLISRTGYTGEDGFELYCAPVDVVKLWNDLLAAGKEQGLLPAGLGARDTLRLEAGFCLYGHELDEQTNPLEARLGWTVKLKKGSFIGHDVLQRVKAEGPARLLVGIELIERGVPRGGYAIYDGEQQIGSLRSGAPGPTVKKNIAMGFVEAAHATVGRQVQVEIRGKRVAAQIVALPFYKRQK